jgi:hypothetical protein
MKLFFNLLALTFLLVSCHPKKKSETVDPEKSTVFLDSLSRQTFDFFWEQADSITGNQPDRWPTPSFSSIAATGFGLSSYLVGVNRGYITREQAAERVLKTLRFFNNAPKGPATSGVTGNNGFFYHFINMRDGLRFKEVELSTIDTGLLMAGILSCQSFFDKDNETEKEIRSLSDALFLAVDWNWAMNGKETMSMGWHPEKGFLDASWQGYNEAMLLYIFGLGSPSHPIPDDSWKAWTKTYQWGTSFGQEHINFGPLFGHQYSHLFIDFKGIQDEYTLGKGIISRTHEEQPSPTDLMRLQILLGGQAMKKMFGALPLVTVQITTTKQIQTWPIWVILPEVPHNTMCKMMERSRQLQREVQFHSHPKFA